MSDASARFHERGPRDPCPSRVIIEDRSKAIRSSGRMSGDPFCLFRRRPAMSTVLHQFVISSRELARWLDSQPGTWWCIDGEFQLLAKVHYFPCPNDVLAEALRQIDRDIMIYTDKTVDLDEGRAISADELPLLADTRNRHQNRDFFASWEGSDVEWLLTEDKWSAEVFAEDAMEGGDVKATDGPESKN
jgi:hypothetical protein